MAISRRKKLQYDIVVGPEDDPQFLGEDIAKAIKFKGYCTIKTNGLEKDIEAAKKEIKEMHLAGRFMPTPAIIIDGLLGEEGSIRYAELMQDNEICVAMTKLDSMLSGVATMVGSSKVLQSMDMGISGRTPGLVHEAGLLSEDPPELQQDCVIKWLNTFIWQRLMLVLCLGPGQGTLEMTPFDSEGNVHRVQTEAGMLVILRADQLWHKHSVPGTGTYTLTTFLQNSGRNSGQGHFCEHPTIPIAQTLDDWAMTKLETAIEDPDTFDLLDSRWKYAVEHVYHKEQQYAVRGVGIKHSCTWDSEAFWFSMNAGADIVTEVPYQRWDHRMYYNEDPEGWKYFKVITNHVALCDGMDLFDAKFFRISPAETKGMDPMQRQIMEVGYVALAAAGRTVKNLLQSLTAVYVGCHLTEWPMVDQGPEEAGGCEQRSAGTGQAGSIMSNRFSFVFGMNGPSVQFDTDASSGLAALETGTVALDERKPNATMSMCMGICVTLTPLTWIHRCGLGQISPLGRCLTFDASATGWVKGEGGCAFAVDNLTEKVDGISIIDDSRYYLGTLGTVKINHAGMQANLGTPHGPSIQMLVSEACRQAHISPCSLDAVEVMGDGQLMNDAVEVASVKTVCFSEPRIPLGLSAMKTNYGNSIQGSSLASVTKALYCQAYGWQQPSNHLQGINPHIADIVDGSMYINNELLLNSTTSSLYAVNSIGWGGTMGCAICSSGLDPARTALDKKAYNYEPMVFWPGGGGEEFPEPYTGYHIVGSWNWNSPEVMETDSPGIYTFVVTLGVNRFEDFQIRYDGDPNLVLHPGVEAGTAASTVYGPNSGAFGLNWRIDGRVKIYALKEAQEDGGPAAGGAQDALALPGGSSGKVEKVFHSAAGVGDRYLVQLNIAGKWKAVTWDRIGGIDQSSEALKAMISDPVVEGKYYFTGAPNAWGYDEMEKSTASPGLWTKEVRLLRGGGHFQIVRNQDRRQVFHPERFSQANPSTPAMGPDGEGQALSWEIGGEAGDVYLIEFQRKLDTGLDMKQVNFRFLRHEAVSPEEQLLMKKPRYCIVGSWDGFQSITEMTPVPGEQVFHYTITVSNVGFESFQILEEGNWSSCCYPSVSYASPHVEHRLFLGPDPQREDLVWSVGTHENEEGSAGLKYQVTLHTDFKGRAHNVTWKLLN